MMIYGIIVSIFLTSMLPLNVSSENGACCANQATLLEDIKLILTDGQQDWSDRAGDFGHELLDFRDDFFGLLRTQTETLDQDLNENTHETKELGHLLGQQIKELKKEITKEIGDMRQEKESQNSEVLDVLRQILKSQDVANIYLPKIADCASLYKSGIRASGIYWIKPDGLQAGFDVYCDMGLLDGGGWTLIQRRGPYGTPDDYFLKTWDEYKNGFGKLDEELWLGNDRISALTRQGSYELLIKMRDTENNNTYANYKTFEVSGEDQLYQLKIGNFSGNTTDDMEYHNGMKFTTIDRDNAFYPPNCAQVFGGAWWYNYCFKANLNGVKSLMRWDTTGSDPKVHLSYIEMKIRPVSD